MNHIFICSALRGDIEENQYRAEFYSRYAMLEHEVAVMVPHLLYTRFLDDEIEKDRDLAIAAGLSFLGVCDQLWCFSVGGVISSGMKKELVEALKLKKPIKYFSVELEDEDFVIVPLTHLPDNKIASKSDLVNPVQYSIDLKRQLSSIEQALTKGGNYNDYEKSLDEMLGTSMTDRDMGIETAWEHNRSPETD